MCSDIDIAYKNKFEHIRDNDSDRSLTWRGKRQDLTEQYGWAIPNHEALDVISDNGPIVSLGAGYGYWESLLHEMGVNVVALDIEPPDQSDQYLPVVEGTQDDLRNAYSDRTLLLVYPPPSHPMAYEALQASSCDTCVFVGEADSTITGGMDFHNELQSHWKMRHDISLPSWPNTDTRCRVFTRYM